MLGHGAGMAGWSVSSSIYLPPADHGNLGGEDVPAPGRQTGAQRGGRRRQATTEGSAAELLAGRTEGYFQASRERGLLYT